MAMDDPDTNIAACRLVRRMYPHAKVLAARATASMRGG
jgi:hypothetical protein